MKYILEKFICKIKGYELVMFNLDKKVIPLLYVRNPKRPIIAMKSLWGILIDNLFFKLDNEEKTTTLWHERYHQKATTGIKLCFWLPLRKIFIKCDRKYTIIQLEEFDADKYAMKKTNKVSILKTLKKLKLFEKEKLIKSNLKNHPSIEERINRINSH